MSHYLCVTRKVIFVRKKVIFATQKVIFVRKKVVSVAQKVVSVKRKVISANLIAVRFSFTEVSVAGDGSMAIRCASRAGRAAYTFARIGSTTIGTPTHCSRRWMIFSMPTKAPHTMNRMFVVSIWMISFWGRVRAPSG